VSDPASLVLVGGIFFLGGFVKGGIGLGLPTVVMGLLSITMPLGQAAAMIVIPAVATNIWQMLAGPALLTLLRRFAPMMLGVVVGTFATVDLLTQSNSLAKAGLGAALASYGSLGFLPGRLEIGPRAERWLSPVVGLLTGGISGATGVFVIPAVPYISSLRLEREQLIQAIGIHAFINPLAIGAALMVRGQYPAGAALTGFVALLPAFVGMYAGQRLRRRLNPEVFRRWFFAGLICLGGYMVVRSL